MDLATGKRDEAVALEEIKDTLTQQICDDAYMVSVVEAISQVDALVTVVLVIRRQS